MTDLARAVVVTGASTGIGRAISAKVAASGGVAFAAVRKEEDAASLKQELGGAVHPLLFDVGNETAVRGAAAIVEAKLAGRALFGLVNNAGIAVPGPLLHLESEDLRRQFEINLIGVHAVTRAFAPLLGAAPGGPSPKGRVVMMSSVGGRNASPFLGPYNSSKFALEGYSEALRRELMMYGVDVIVIGPGVIATPIWDKGERAAYARFEATPYAEPIRRLRTYLANVGPTGLAPEEVAALVWRALTRKKPRTRYSILRRPFKDETLPRLLPKRLVDRVIARRLGLIES